MKKITFILIIAILLSFISCSGRETNINESKTVYEGCELLITADNSISSLAYAYLSMDDNADTYKNSYYFKFDDAENSMMEIVNGDFDIAVLPTDMAYYLYGRTEGNCPIIAVTNTVKLSLIGNIAPINSLSDLTGKTIYTTDKNDIYSYVLKYILSSNNIEAEIEKADLNDESIFNTEDIIILTDEASALYYKENYSDISDLCDISAEWKKCSGLDEEIPLYVAVANNKFANANPGGINYFIEESKMTIAKLLEDSGAAEMILNSDINLYIDLNADILSKSGLTVISGEQLNIVTNFANEISKTNPELFNGGNPKEDILYNKIS